MTADPQLNTVQRAEQQLSMTLKCGTALDVVDELSACWEKLKSDPTISDPAATMLQLSEWLVDEVQKTIDEELL